MERGEPTILAIEDRLETHLELVREGEYLLEVELCRTVGDPDDPWKPTYSVSEAQRLYEAAQAMREHDWVSAGRYGRLYRLQPVNVPAKEHEHAAPATR